MLEHLEPKDVFTYFEELTKIPHESYHTKEISDYCVKVAKELGLEVFQDSYHNVRILKPASKGYESAKTVVIQGHLDMVCEKDADCTIDFSKDALALKIDSQREVITADKTTLGGDDGIAVAMALSILKDSDFIHPPLEILLTTEEEVGMDGAKGVAKEWITGEYLLNLDSEEEGVLTVGCAGGTTIAMERINEMIIKNGFVVEADLSGFAGGHSGTDINKHRSNAVKELARIVYAVIGQSKGQLVALEGGLKHNAIPREASCKLYYPTREAAAYGMQVLNNHFTMLKHEQEECEPDMTFCTHCYETNGVRVFYERLQNEWLEWLIVVPNGVQRMSPAIDSLVETSLNLGIVRISGIKSYVETSLRSCVESRLEELKQQVLLLAKRYRMDAVVVDEYPGWEYKRNMKLQQIMQTCYETCYHSKPKIEVIHAGLECGILLQKKPDLQIVSIGPDIFDIHTTREALSIPSTKRVYQYVCEVLTEIANQTK